MKNHLRAIATLAAVGALCAAIPFAANAHVESCTTLEGIKKARCERHEKKYAVCGSVIGEAHFTCDRSFLLDNPLNCAALDDANAKLCTAEAKAFDTCKPKQGREFLVCVKEQTAASPM